MSHVLDGLQYHGALQNLILQSDTVCRFSGRFVMTQADAKRCKALIIKAGMTCEDC